MTPRARSVPLASICLAIGFAAMIELAHLGRDCTNNGTTHTSDEYLLAITVGAAVAAATAFGVRLAWSWLIALSLMLGALAGLGAVVWAALSWIGACAG
jgi:hypothetical protein